MELLEGKVAFITGAARGQGRSHAVRLAAEGADIIAVDVCAPVSTIAYDTATPDDLAETVRQVEALDRRIVATRADTRDLAALTSAVDTGVAELGRLDIVLANAGIFGSGRMLDMDEDAWSTMIDVNLTRTWKTLRAATPHIVAGGRGGAMVHYSAAKAGLIGMMKVVAKELGPQRIRVNSVHPTTWPRT